MKTPEKIKQFSEAAVKVLATTDEEALKAGDIGYMARMLVQTTLPHRAFEGTHFERTNGHVSLTLIAANKKIGLPFGVHARRITAWITTEAKRTEEPILTVIPEGGKFSDFMRRLGYKDSSGGRGGSITQLKMQLKRVASTAFSSEYSFMDEAGNKRCGIELVTPFRGYQWWEPKNPEQLYLFPETLILSTEFFNEIINNSVPFRLDALNALGSSCMAMDIYIWATYMNRPGERRKDCYLIPWEALEQYFGAENKGKYGKYHFKDTFIAGLKRVLPIYPEVAKFQINENGILFVRGRPHVSPKEEKKILEESYKAF